MKGIIFNLIERIVVESYDEDTWDDLLDSAGLDGAYSSLGSYDDQDLTKIVAAASQALDMEPSEVVRMVGQRALPMMAELYPGFFSPHTNARSFILALNDIIHPEVRKLYPGADVPVFDFDTRRDDLLIVGYHSHRKMCSFALGLIAGAAIYYGETALIEEPLCMHRGDEHCEFRLAFSKQDN